MISQVPILFQYQSYHIIMYSVFSPHKCQPNNHMREIHFYTLTYVCMIYTVLNNLIFFFVSWISVWTVSGFSFSIVISYDSTMIMSYVIFRSTYCTNIKFNSVNNCEIPASVRLYHIITTHTYVYYRYYRYCWYHCNVIISDEGEKKERIKLFTSIILLHNVLPMVLQGNKIWKTVFLTCNNNLHSTVHNIYCKPISQTSLKQTISINVCMFVGILLLEFDWTLQCT